MRAARYGTLGVLSSDSTGIIIYDSSGWMSVHIVAPQRRGWPPDLHRAQRQLAVRGAHAATDVPSKNGVMFCIMREMYWSFSPTGAT